MHARVTMWLTVEEFVSNQFCARGTRGNTSVGFVNIGGESNTFTIQTIDPTSSYGIEVPNTLICSKTEINNFPINTFSNMPFFIFEIQLNTLPTMLSNNA